MSMRLIFKTLDVRPTQHGIDPPEKSKLRTRKSSIFRNLHYDEEEEEEDEFNHVELSGSCFCNSVLLVLSLLVFGASVFSLGMAFQQQQQQQQPLSWVGEAIDQAVGATGAPPPPPPPPPPAPLFSPQNGSGVEFTSQTPSEYIYFRLNSEAESRRDALASVEVCVRLILNESLTLRVPLILVERGQEVFLKQESANSDDVLEWVSGAEFSHKLTACTGRQITDIPKYIFR